MIDDPNQPTEERDETDDQELEPLGSAVESTDPEIEETDAFEVIAEDPAYAPDVERWERAAGALALGVLDPDQLDEANLALAASPALREEVALLQPVADILRGLYQSSPASAVPVESTEPINNEAAATEALAATAPPKPKRTRKPAPTQANIGLSRAMPSVPWAKVIVGGAAALAVLAILWAFALLDQIDARDNEIAAQATEIANLHAAGNASAYLLYPTADGGTAQGTLYYSPANNTAVIDVINLPPLEDGRVYQIWFQQAGSTSWIPGPTFTVNSSGQAVQRLAGDAPTFAQVAITNEPTPGNTEPTGPFLVTGVLAQANG